MFVPPNCTPVLQTLDVGVNKELKQSVSQCCCDYYVKEISRQISAGTATKDFVLLHKKTDIVPHFMNWLSESVKMILGNENIVKNAWKRTASDEECQTGLKNGLLDIVCPNSAINNNSRSHYFEMALVAHVNKTLWNAFSSKESHSVSTFIVDTSAVITSDEVADPLQWNLLTLIIRKFLVFLTMY